MKRNAISSAFTASLAALLLALSTTGCKKDKTDDPEPADPACLLTRINDGAEYVAYTYDDQNRVVRTQSPDSTYATYTYETGAIEVDYYDETGIWYDQLVCSLNAAGNVSEAVSSHESWQMTYDADGYLTQLVFTSGLDTSTLQIVTQNGNLVSATGSDNEGNTSQQLFTYYTEQDSHWENKGGVINVASSYPMFTGDGVFYPLPIGKVSTHLVRTFVAYENGQEERSFELEYVLNAEGYVTGINYGTGLGLVTCEYECQ